ncbi:prepilin-type N-terminal cleavage/methylation domain-containing protein [Naasia aerilata]|uniref:alpha-amylase n=1 Tax=Naasia aerilata TaxID=1162966 RepID=A0ABM8GAA2_9MICO|nr:prepilin-type N-terminal cleavage/methylation domain-containing protein [Naasia aerilata]BDZ45120.1 hypothetical protein GCM10025866_10290 [Naasia aerilata]
MVDTNELRRTNDDGFTIIEVVVAMMVFAIIALGVSFSTITTIRMTGDARSREVAANLAASEIDAVRAAPDPFTVLDATRTVTIDGTRYTVARSAGWVSTTGTSSGCGTGTGNLQYKRVNVAVSWSGQLNSNSAARADTILAPSSRLNDPRYGSVLVSVLDANGAGASGVTVSLSSTAGGATVTSSIPSTDADGCSYAFKVSEGTYEVRVSRSASLDPAQQSTPVKTIVVKKGRPSRARSSTTTPPLSCPATAPAPTPRPSCPPPVSTSATSARPG